MSNLKSKIMKAAHKMFKKYKNKTSTNWSKSLVKAWRWAKDVLVNPSVNGKEYSLWTPRKGFARLYFSDKSFVQLTMGKHYEVSAKAEGSIAESIIDNIEPNDFILKLT